MPNRKMITPILGLNDVRNFIDGKRNVNVIAGIFCNGDLLRDAGPMNRMSTFRFDLGTMSEWKKMKYLII